MPDQENENLPMEENSQEETPQADKPSLEPTGGPQEEVPAPKEEPETPAPKKKSGWGLAIVAILVVLAAIAYMLSTTNLFKGFIGQDPRQDTSRNEDVVSDLGQKEVNFSAGSEEIIEGESFSITLSPRSSEEKIAIWSDLDENGNPYAEINKVVSIEECGLKDSFKKFCTDNQVLLTVEECENVSEGICAQPFCLSGQEKYMDCLDNGGMAQECIERANDVCADQELDCDEEVIKRANDISIEAQLDDSEALVNKQLWCDWDKTHPEEETEPEPEPDPEPDPGKTELCPTGEFLNAICLDKGGDEGACEYGAAITCADVCLSQYGRYLECTIKGTPESVCSEEAFRECVEGKTEPCPEDVVTAAQEFCKEEGLDSDECEMEGLKICDFMYLLNETPEEFGIESRMGAYLSPVNNGGFFKTAYAATPVSFMDRIKEDAAFKDYLIRDEDVIIISQGEQVNINLLKRGNNRLHIATASTIYDLDILDKVGTTPSPDPDPDPDPEPEETTAPPELAFAFLGSTFEHDDDNGVVDPGQLITFTMTVKNSSDTDAGELAVVMSTLNENLEDLQVVATTDDCGATLAAGEQCTKSWSVNVKIDATPEETFDVEATIQSDIGSEEKTLSLITNQEPLIGQTECSDGVDNDNDSLVDYPEDTGCIDGLDNNETDAAIQPDPQCDDGVDNDNDGLIDQNDPGCENSSDNDEEDPLPACSDWEDNDNDGLIDIQDPGCENGTDDDETDPEEVETTECSDGIDNDGDGDVDLDDDGCPRPDDDNEDDPEENVSGPLGYPELSLGDLDNLIDEVAEAIIVNNTCLDKGSSLDFEDLDSEYYGKNVIRTLSTLDYLNVRIAEGYELDEDREFKPFQEMTRAEFLKMATWATCYFENEDIEIDESDDAEFTDSTESDWYFELLNGAYESDLIEGFEDGSFGANNSLTRAEGISILIGIIKDDLDSCKNEDENPFIDVTDNDWFYDDALIAYHCEISQGEDISIGDETKYLFNGNELVTRGEIAIMLYNTFIAQGDFDDPEISTEFDKYDCDIGDETIEFDYPEDWDVDCDDDGMSVVADDDSGKLIITTTLPNRDDYDLDEEATIEIDNSNYSMKVYEHEDEENILVVIDMEDDIMDNDILVIYYENEEARDLIEMILNSFDF